MASPIKLVVADDRLIVREGLKHIIGDCADMKLVGEAASWDEALEQARAAGPDVLLLDRFLAGAKILPLIREVNRRHRRCRVLLLNVPEEDPDALRILGTGAGGYLSEHHSRPQLIEAIRQVARGASYVSPSLASLLISYIRRGGDRPRHDVLSEREHQVLRLVGSGVSMKRIAAELGVSPKTVSTYRSRILDKLKLKSNADMIRYAIVHHLMPPSPSSPQRRRTIPTGGSAKP